MTDTPYLKNAFPPASKAAIYEVIYRRRDIHYFRPDPLPEEAIVSILQAAHHAPSVGFMQPWNFVLIKDKCIKQQVAAVFERENALAAKVYDNERQKLYHSL